MQLQTTQDAKTESIANANNLSGSLKGKSLPSVPVQLMMKRSTRMVNFGDVEKHEGAAAEEGVQKDTIVSGETSKDVPIGMLKKIYEDDTIEEGNKRYQILESLLESIAGKSKGHQHITGSPQLMAIFRESCRRIGCDVPWTGLNEDDDEEE